MMRSTERWMRATLVLALAASLGGCGAQGGITGGEAPGVASENSAEYLDRMSSQETVTENDALSGMLMLLDGQDQAKTFAQRVESLQKRQILAPAWSHDANRATTRGRLAYMISQATRIEGGIILRVCGPSQRYCLRELQYVEMMGPGTARGDITGMELVAVITRADVYIRTGEIPNIAGEIEN